MQLSAQTTLAIGLAGAQADSGPRDVMTRTSIEDIPFGRVCASSGNVLRLVLSGTITTGTIDLKVNGTAITQVTYATSHAVTMQLIADAIDTVLGKVGATQVSTNTLIITNPLNQPLKISNFVSSQGLTQTHTLDLSDDLARLPRQTGITIALAGAMVTNDFLSGYLNSSTNLLSVAFQANSMATTLGAMATLIKAEPGIKDATVSNNSIIVTADDHKDVTALFTSTTQAVTYVESCSDTFLGVSTRSLKEAGISTDAQSEDGDAVGIARKGRWFTENASAGSVTPATALFVRFAPTPAADRGKITDAAGTNPVVAVAWTAAKAYKTAAAAALIDLEMNQP